MSDPYSNALLSGDFLSYIPSEGSKETKKGKKKSSNVFDFTDLSYYINKGNKGKSSVEGFGQYVYYGGQGEKGDLQKGFESYIPDIGSEKNPKPAYEGLEGLGSAFASSERTIGRSTRRTIKSYEKYNEPKIKAREEAEKQKHKNEAAELEISAKKLSQERIEEEKIARKAEREAEHLAELEKAQKIAGFKKQTADYQHQLRLEEIARIEANRKERQERNEEREKSNKLARLRRIQGRSRAVPQEVAPQSTTVRSPLGGVGAKHGEHAMIYDIQKTNKYKNIFDASDYMGGF